MSTHNICFCREIRKILCGYPSYGELTHCHAFQISGASRKLFFFFSVEAFLMSTQNIFFVEK